MARLPRGVRGLRRASRTGFSEASYMDKTAEGPSDYAKGVSHPRLRTRSYTEAATSNHRSPSDSDPPVAQNDFAAGLGGSGGGAGILDRDKEVGALGRRIIGGFERE